MIHRRWGAVARMQALESCGRHLRSDEGVSLRWKTRESMACIFVDFEPWKLMYWPSRRCAGGVEWRVF